MIRILIIACFLFMSLDGNTQRFKGALLGGINISQIDGDGEAGYHKWGLTGGGKMSYEVYSKMDISIEMLYSQRGSRSVRKIDPWIINLDYLEVPLIYSIKDWYQEKENYYKARLDLGLVQRMLGEVRYLPAKRRRGDAGAGGLVFPFFDQH